MRELLVRAEAADVAKSHIEADKLELQFCVILLGNDNVKT
jgi:hypothetical protein